MSRALRWLLAAVALALAASESLHRWASTTGLPASALQPSDAGPHAVLVLGYRSTSRGPNAMQRWRTDIAVRSAGDRGLLVISGGAHRPASRTEAEVMAEDAQRRYGFPRERVRPETRARTTWQNVELSAPLLTGARTIAVASSPLHAARARQHLRAQHPELASRLVPAQDYRLLERPLLKLATVLRTLHPRRARILLHALLFATGVAYLVAGG